MNSKPIVFIVDDDSGVRTALQVLMESVGQETLVYESAQAFLDDYTSGKPGCLILDVRMPGMSGLTLQEQLSSRGIFLPVIMLTGHGDVVTAVQAMKAGAWDYIEKPFNNQMLLDCVQRAIKHDLGSHRQRLRREQLLLRYDQLTAREREVMALLVKENSNKLIARQLGIALRTVEFHRARVMRKMQADSLFELIHIASLVGDSPG